MSKRVAPFQFSALEKVSRSQVDLLRRLEWLLPAGLLTDELTDSVREGLHRVFDEDVMLWLDYVHTVQPSALKKVMADPSFLGVIAPSPHGPRGLVEVDLVLAHGVVDLLLGAPDESAVVRPLTEVEQGVVSYVLLETFRALSPGPPEPGRQALKLERIVPTLDEGLQLLAGEPSVAIVEFKVLIGAAAGHLRLLLPAGAMSSASPPEAQPSGRQRLVKRIEANGARLGGVRVVLRAEIGKAELTARDIAALRTGDVMIVDSLTARPDKGEKGIAHLVTGSGRAGYLETSIESEGGGSYKATVQKVVLGGAQRRAPGEGALAAAERVLAACMERALAKARAAGKPGAAPARHRAEEGDEEPVRATAMATFEEKLRPNHRKGWGEENTNVSNKPEEANVEADAIELLNDVPLQIAVELGRVSVTAEELVSLHVGRIFDLGKPPSAQVDLSVNGKVVARGELVEIEGQLGVRIVGMGR